MNPLMPKPEFVPDGENESRAPSLRSVVRKSALLNIVVVLTSAPVLLVEGGPKAIVVTLEIMAGISIVIWTATYALYSLVTLPWIFWTPASLVKRQDPSLPAQEAEVDDCGIDGPV
jgi:hypothetical protein